MSRSGRASQRPEARGGRQWDRDTGRMTRDREGRERPDPVSQPVARPAPSQPTQYQRPKPNPTRAVNNTRGSDGMTNVERWEKYSKPNFNVVDIDTGKDIRVAAKKPVEIPKQPVRPVRNPEGDGGGSTIQTPEKTDSGQAPGRMLQGIQKRRGGEAMGAARMTRKGLGGINRANNKKLGGI